MYKDYVIPAGTPISQTPYFILTHPGVFPEPHIFRPERWLDGGKLSNKLDKYFVAFGKGSRQCLGMKFVYPPPRTGPRELSALLCSPLG